MSEFDSESRGEARKDLKKDRTSTVWVALIAAVTIVVLTCIAACTVITYAFFQNPPW